MKTLLSLVALLVQAANAAKSAPAPCSFQGSPPGLGTFTLEPITQTAKRPVKILGNPQVKDEFYIVEQAGTVRMLKQDGTWGKTFLDIQDRVTTLSGPNDERGLLGLALHPKFAQNKRVFVNYTTKSTLYTHVSEFKVGSNGLADPNSEKVLLEVQQPYANHNGGEIAFGPDGYLYVGMGDGGSGGDPGNFAQNGGSLLGKMLRINVDETGKKYGIPKDNPFVGKTGFRAEIWALGLRNPWRFSFDRVTGLLWAADVGQNQWEEIDIIKKGGNYGWKIMEGNHCYDAQTCDQTNLIKPVYEYQHTEGVSVTGGFVYRGKKYPELLGNYIMADYSNGRIWGLLYDGNQVTSSSVLATTGVNITSFGEDADGELYVASAQGLIYRLMHRPTAGSFPMKLSDTGCFASLKPLQPIEGFVQYEVNSPLWSDGTVKSRFMKTPEGQKIEYRPGYDAWHTPEGTVVMKNFALPKEGGGTQIIETRFLYRHCCGVYGYTYRWNEDQTDAEYLAGAQLRDVTMWENGQEVAFEYYYPGPNECARCHMRTNGGFLGIFSEQLNRDTNLGGTTMHQFDYLRIKGALSELNLPTDYSTLPKLVDYRDVHQDLTSRARSFLHVQCASCHHPGNPAAQGNQDFRAQTAFAEMKICNADSQNGNLGISGAKLLFPGHPEKSILNVRAESTDMSVRMPPLATNRKDQVGIAVLRDWVTSVNSCQ